MKSTIFLVALMMMLLAGCAPLGGQAVVGYAETGGVVKMYVYIVDGGTDMGGLFYRPSGGTLVRTEETSTTQPSRPSE